MQDEIAKAIAGGRFDDAKALVAKAEAEAAPPPVTVENTHCPALIGAVLRLIAHSPLWDAVDKATLADAILAEAQGPASVSA